MAMPQVIIKAPGTHVLLTPRHQDFPGRLGLGAMETGHGVGVSSASSMINSMGLTRSL